MRSSHAVSHAVLYLMLCCGMQHLELWLALLKLESYHTGRLVLNNARQRFFTAPAIWITTAKHEEAHGNIDIVAKIIDRAIISLTANGVMIDRDFWLKVCCLLLVAAAYRCYSANFHLSGLLTGC